MYGCDPHAIVGFCIMTGCFMHHGPAHCDVNQCKCDPGYCSSDGHVCEKIITTTASEAATTVAATSIAATSITTETPTTISLGLSGARWSASGDLPNSACDADTLDIVKHHCHDVDKSLAKYTVWRYVVLGSYMTYIVYRLKRRAQCLGEEELKHAYPFQANPRFTSALLRPRYGCLGIEAFVYAFGIFIQSEGVGLVVYFAVSAALDNAMIFVLGDVFCACKYKTAVALYTCALLTFLPTAGLAKAVQKRWYDSKPWLPCQKQESGEKIRCYENRIFFLLALTLVTVIFFGLRVWFVQKFRVIDLVGTYLHDLGDFKVVVAACVPPIVDLIQSIILVAASRLQGAEARENDNANAAYMKLGGGNDDA